MNVWLVAAYSQLDKTGGSCSSEVEPVSAEAEAYPCDTQAS